jgi:uncharacterized protein (DUF433 family)
MDYQRIITIEPGKRGGKPCIGGSRLSRDDIRACLAFAADRERRLVSIPGK